jgi:hypothetical protein
MLRQGTRVNLLPSSYPRRRFTAIRVERWREIHSLQEPYSELLFEGTIVQPDALGSRGRRRDFRATLDVRGCADRLLVLTRSEDRAGSVPEHFFCDASFHQSSQPAPTVSHHHDQIRGQPLRDVYYYIGRLTHIIENLPGHLAEILLGKRS